jgi:hypothetical protein
MITVPVWLFVSQWFLLFTFGFLLFVAYRQMSFLLGLSQLGTNKEGLEIGEDAPSFSLVYVNRSVENSPVYFNAKGEWSLLLFADPNCAGCQQAIPMIERLVAPREKPLRTIILTSADQAFIEASDVFQQTSLAIARIQSEVSLKLYLVHTIPFACVVNPEGRIHAKGLISDESSARRILAIDDRYLVPLESVHR